MNLFKKTIIKKVREKEQLGRRYMSLAEKLGRIPLKRNLYRYSAEGMKELNIKDGGRNAREFPDGTFYLSLPLAAYECDPLLIARALKIPCGDLHEFLSMQSKPVIRIPIETAIEQKKAKRRKRGA
jgi:hypothetical protein